MKDIKWMLANYSSGEIARDAISEIINLEQELAKLKEENEKFRKMLQDNEDKYTENRDDLYYEISKLKELLRRFVPDERTIQWEQREIDARDFLKKYDMAIGHDFRNERLNEQELAKLKEENEKLKRENDDLKNQSYEATKRLGW